MTRYAFDLNSSADRERAAKVIADAPKGTRVELKAAKRSIPQNDKMWSILSEIAVKKQHAGRHYTPDQWKIIFMHACGREVQFIPSLNGETFIPWGQRSSDLSKGEMSDLLEFIISWCAENNVPLSDLSEAA